MANKSEKIPTREELGNSVLEISKRQNDTMRYLNQLDRLLGLYIEMNKQKGRFNDFVQEKVEQEKTERAEMEQESIERESRERNESKGNEESDKEDILEYTDNKGAGSKGVRKAS